jgi:putative endonuclease
MADHNELGIKGEQLAVEFLIRKGYKVIDRNYRFKKWEVDIIAEENVGELVVVEVKTRNSDYLADASETVTRGKQASIVKAANEYIQEKDLDVECRFDVISIILNDKEEKIEHIEDAFYPTL